MKVSSSFYEFWNRYRNKVDFGSKSYALMEFQRLLNLDDDHYELQEYAIRHEDELREAIENDDIQDGAKYTICIRITTDIIYSDIPFKAPTEYVDRLYFVRLDNGEYKWSPILANTQRIFDRDIVDIIEYENPYGLVYINVVEDVE